ncbi:MAG: hypothetical protein WCL44_12960 [bacterium]
MTSAELQKFLSVALRTRLNVSASPEFALTWKDWDMPAGEPICALRASERRTGDKGCSGWPPPAARYCKDGDSQGVEDRTDKLPGAARLAHWHTPTVRDLRNSGGDGKNPRCLVRQAALASWPTPDTTDSNTRPNGKGGATMTDVARLAAWPTPQTKDSGQSQTARNGGENLAVIAAWATPRAEDAESAGMRHSRGVADTLTAQAGQGLPLAGWQTPKLPSGGPCKRNTPGGGLRKLEDQADGAISTSCPAVTGKRGVLRPGHSRWLMGYPAAWDSCGATGMQSCRKSRRSL